MFGNIYRKYYLGWLHYSLRQNFLEVVALPCLVFSQLRLLNYALIISRARSFIDKSLFFTCHWYYSCQSVNTNFLLLLSLRSRRIIWEGHIYRHIWTPTRRVIRRIFSHQTNSLLFILWQCLYANFFIYKLYTSVNHYALIPHCKRAQPWQGSTGSI